MDDSVINAHACGKQFDGSKRLQNDELWAAYSTGKQTAVGKALWRLTLTLKDCHKVTFQSALQAWFEQHEGFLNERTINEETGSSSHYTHKTLRSAYLSLKRNLDYLFTFGAYPGFGIHNTTNLLDGRFADLKRKLGVITR